MDSTIKLVLQYTMHNDLKSGRKLVVRNGVPHKLMNMAGSSFYPSNHLDFHFDVALLQHYVRLASDPILQKIIQLLRKITPLDEDENIGLSIAL